VKESARSINCAAPEEIWDCRSIRVLDTSELNFTGVMPRRCEGFFIRYRKTITAFTTLALGCVHSPLALGCVPRQAASYEDDPDR
jgi:hypothetical protein